MKKTRDFYILPFSVIQNLLIEDNLYLLKGKQQRWVEDVQSCLTGITENDLYEISQLAIEYHKNMIFDKF